VALRRTCRCTEFHRIKTQICVTRPQCVKLRDLSVCIVMRSIYSQCGRLLKICCVSLFYYDLRLHTSRLVNEYVPCLFVSGFISRPFCLRYILPYSQEMWDKSGWLQSNRPSPSSGCFSGYLHFLVNPCAVITLHL
jgi:hypothetical protein